MNWFVRAFAGSEVLACEQRVTDLERRLSDESRARESLEITNASLQRENEFLRERFDQAVNNERSTLRFLANVQSQTKWGVKPFPTDTGLPETPTDEKPVEMPHRMQGVDMVKAAKDHALEELDRRIANGEMGGVDPNMVREAMAFL